MQTISFSRCQSGCLRFTAGLLLGVLSLFFSNSLTGQVHNIPSSGSDTSTACFGLLRDPGGTGSYSSYSEGYFVIDPVGSSNVSLLFSSFNLASGDYVRIYDGVGTGSTFLGSYTGSSLPGGGSAILSSGGAITVRFSSNCCSQSSGFELSWTTSASSLPTANFAVNTAPAYNTPVQFINTTTNGGTYLWEFGDGQTSTDANPIHRYTTAGPMQARVIATNCSGTDTSAYKTITVQAAPNGSVSTDTVTLTVPCGGSNSGSFTISNSGSGSMSYNLELEQNTVNTIFSETFENSTLGDFINLSSSDYTTTIQTTGAPQGGKYLRLTGSGYINSGLSGSFSNSQPEYLSYRVKDDSYGYFHGGVHIGTGTTYTGYKFLFYSEFVYNQLRLYYNNASGNLVNTQLAQNQGTWFNIELKNIDFTAKTYDIYVDGVLTVSNAHFIDNTLNDINNFLVYNSSYGDIGLDDFQVSAKNYLNKITYNPKTGSLTNGSSNVIFINADATNLNAGVYWLQFVVSSNDTALDGLIIPLRLEVTGTEILSQGDTCLNFGTVYTGFIQQDSVLLSNSGCDTLDFTSIISTHSDFSVSSSSLHIPPGDSVYLHVSLNSVSAQSYVDTIYLTGPDTNTTICLNATSMGAPVITTDSSAYTLNINDCLDSVGFGFNIINTGQSDLVWNILSSKGYVTDDFENGFNSTIWQSHGTNIINSSCYVNSGIQTLFFAGSNRSAETVPFNISGTDSIRFWISTASFNLGCEAPDLGEDLIFEYSTNGVTWNIIQVFTNSQPQGFVNMQVPPGAVSSSTRFRFRQVSYTVVNGDNYLIDDFGIGNSTKASFTPNSDTTSTGDTTYVSGYFNIEGFTSGSYTRTVSVASNDPVHPTYSFPVTLNIIGIPNIVLPTGCLDLDTAMTGASNIDSILVANDGCGDLILSGLSVNTTDFSVLSGLDTLSPGDSIFIRIQYTGSSVLGAAHDTLTITSNDTTAKYCLSGLAIGAPAASISPDSIYVNFNSCNDSVTIPVTLYNSGAGILDYQIGGSGAMDLQGVLDIFRMSSAQVAAKNPQPYNFSDGLINYYINDGGSDMYDGGNYLSTNLTFSNLYYSNDLITSASGALGTGGQYFTYKGNGIWLFAADIDGVNNFDIDGNLGADGYGLVDGTVLNTTINGIPYKGFVKRVYSAGNPSVNHLIMVEDIGSPSHSYSSSTNSDYHQITGLGGHKRLYYLLYAGTSGAYINNTATLNIMNTFLSLVHGNRHGNFLTVSPDSGVVAINDSVIINVTISSQGFVNGRDSTTLIVSTNDPLNPQVSIPVIIDINGSSETELLYSGCMDFDSLMVGASALDSLWIKNIGCDSLTIGSVSSSSGDFGLLNLPGPIAPGDSAIVWPTYTPSSMGTVTDTLFFYGNADTVGLCVTGKGLGAPVAIVNPDTLRVTVNKCKGSTLRDFTLQNTGQGAMAYNIRLSSLYQDTGLAYFTTPGAATSYSFGNTPSSADTIWFTVVVNGDFDQSGEDYSVNVEGTLIASYLTQNLTIGNNDTARFFYTGPNIATWLADNILNVTIQNTSGVGVGFPNALDMHFVQVEIGGVAPPWLTMVSPQTGSLSVGSTVIKSLAFDPASLVSGTYNTIIEVRSNDPVNSVVSIPVIFNVIDEPEIMVSDTCLNYPITLVGDTAVQTLWIYNNGCQSLSLSSIISSSPRFKVTPSSGSVLAGDSISIAVEFIPQSVNSFSSSLIISNNDSTMVVCLNAAANAKPVAGFNFSVENVCKGEIAFTDNSQFGPTAYFWDFGDGYFGNTSSVTHSYAKAGTYKVLLTVSNAYGNDTISKTVTVDPFIVEFGISADTVLVNTPVNFYDSTVTASSWTWTFGDGNGSSVQNPVHSYSSIGTYTVTLEGQDARNCILSSTKTIYVYDDVSIDESILDGFQYSLYPNPSTGVITIEASDVDWSEYNFSIYDATGREVKRLGGEGHSIFILDCSDVKAGMYQLVITKKNLVKSRNTLIIK